MSFSVSLAADGVKWQEVFATDSNVLGTTGIPIGFVRATLTPLLFFLAGSAGIVTVYSWTVFPKAT